MALFLALPVKYLDKHFSALPQEGMVDLLLLEDQMGFRGDKDTCKELRSRAFIWHDLEDAFPYFNLNLSI